METITDSGKLKEIFKQAIIEAIEEKKDLVHDLLVDAMEDLAMSTLFKKEKRQERQVGTRYSTSWKAKDENRVCQKLCQGFEETCQ